MNHNNHGWLSSGSDNEDCILQHIPSSSTPSMTRSRNNNNNNNNSNASHNATTTLRRGASNKRATTTTTTTTVYLHQSSSDNDNNVEDTNDSDYQFSQDSSSSSFCDDDDDDDDDNNDDDSTTSKKKKKKKKQQKQLMSNKQKSLNSGGGTTSRKRRETKSLSTTRRKRRKTQNSSSDSRNDSSSSGSDHEVITRRTTRSNSSSSGNGGNGGSSSSRKRTRGNHKFHGFENIGNTCYMGAVLTALFHLEPFLSPSFTQTSNQLNHKKNNSHHDQNVVDCIARLYQLFKKSEESINPSDLKQLLSEKTNMFEGHDQEDAHEFLVTLLSCIQDECQQEQQQENEKDEGDENEESSSNDPIQQNFETYITLYDKCSACHSTNKNTECFPVMTVHFPMEEEEEEATKRSNGLNSAKRATRSSSRSIGKAPTHSIQDLFNHWFTEERIDDVKCNKCKKKTQMIRTKRMDSLPRIFCIHVNRFTHQNVNASRVVKNPRRVIISKQLNIGDGLCERDVAPPAQPTLLPIVAHHVTPSSTSDHQHKKSPDSDAILIDSGDSDNDHHSLKPSANKTNSKNNESDSSFHYELMSIIHHKGRTKEQGHYFTHVNSFGYNQSITDKEQQQMSQDSTAKPTWFEYDDHSVQSLTEKDVLEDASKQATCYVLFYQFKNSSLH